MSRPIATALYFVTAMQLLRLGQHFSPEIVRTLATIFPDKLATKVLGQNWGRGLSEQSLTGRVLGILEIIRHLPQRTQQQ